ncbi:hypothetical protein [Bradyrhizobium sp. CCGUVB23]|uniref:hypothetical protein n=1 Tax=Bradyrhizobium sp. CCGUVB23 TaxID=2949630 RepID=UPI0020B268AB|nr:hypothetical protein [Bradyrhizobium sp. CCGUVB23]MCP3459610.1 hypothetical protein [Bradyrhizobium sp. CCGUVB23]
MEKVRRLRAMSSLCRQQAAYNSMNKWKLLADAEYWEHLADLEHCLPTFSNVMPLARMREHSLSHSQARVTLEGRRLPLQQLRSRLTRNGSRYGVTNAIKLGRAL